MDMPVSFGEWVQLRRKALDLTQAELAERTGCSKSALRKIESGERRPSQQLAELLSADLEIPADYRDVFIRVARGVLNVARLGPAHLGEVDSHQLVRHVSSPSADSSLPISSTPLVGREPELSALEQLLDDPACRLVTIVGLGGIGKTRLAIEATSRYRAKFPDKAFFVSLAPLTSAAAIVAAIADAVGLSFSGPAEPVVQLINHLHKKQALLVLDNMEHLLAGVELISTLLRDAPGIKFLVTSRERLNLLEEWSFDLHGLPVPPTNQTERLDQYNSVALFLLRGRHAAADFEPDDEELLTITHICRLVEGMPLGIELAAAWVPILSCDDIAREIEAGLDFLTSSMRDVPERHRSITAVFDHAWKLLSEEEAQVLNQLSVFRGGFSRQAAERIAGASLNILASLVAKSLVRRHEGTRYDLHELVRQYAFARLNSKSYLDATLDRHCDFYLAVLADREASLKSRTQTEVIRELTDEIDNLRAAVNRAITDQRFNAHLLAALPAIGLLCCIRGWFREGTTQLARIVASLPDDLEDEDWKKVRGLALAQQGRLLQLQGNLVEARKCYEQSLAALRPLNDPSLLAYPLLFYGIALFLSGDLDQARLVTDQGLAYAEADGDTWLMGHGRYDQGYIDSLQGQYASGYEKMMSGLALWRETGDPATIALGLNHIAPTIIKLGWHDEAQALLEESLDLCNQVNDRWGIGTAYRHLGMVALARGSFADAQSHIQKGLTYFTSIGARNDIVQSLVYLGETSTAAGDLAEARRLFLQALDEIPEAALMPNVLQVLLGIAHLYAQAGNPQHVLELSCFILDHTVSSQELHHSADKLRGEATTQLTRSQVQAAEMWAAAQTLETITAAVLDQTSMEG